VIDAQLLGDRKLQASLRRAARETAALERGHTPAAQVVSGAARTRAPRRTGTLAASVRGKGFPGRATVTAHTRYAGIIHWGWPARGIEPHEFIVEAAHATEPVWQAGYTAALQGVANRIEGV
jgi:hypothetical protein